MGGIAMEVAGVINGNIDHEDSMRRDLPLVIQSVATDHANRWVERTFVIR